MPQPCTTCKHPALPEITTLLNDVGPGGQSIGDLADRFGIVKRSLYRHYQSHHGKAPAERPKSPVPGLVALAVQVAAGATVGGDPDENAALLLAELEALQATLQDSVARCQLDGDERTVERLGGQIRAIVVAKARISGALNRRREPCPQCPDPKESPEVAAYVARILAPLQRHPEALAAVRAVMA